MVKDVEVLSLTWLEVPPIVTDDSARFLPVIVIIPPVRALEGVILLIDGPFPPVPSFEQDIVARVSTSNPPKRVSETFFDLFIY